jgi:hypothetical protein
MRIRTFLLTAAIACFATPQTAMACEGNCASMDHSDRHDHHSSHNHNSGAATIMGSHLHEKDEWMVSYKYMHMNMKGNRKGTSNIDPATIATTEANRFSGTAGQPATLRVVPTEMTMDMHMLGAMYAPTDWLTLMAMGHFIEKKMDHVTFAGGAGTAVLGTFTTENQGWGDTQISGLFNLYNHGAHQIIAKAGLSLPTGTIKSTGTVLAPNSNTPRLRLPYAMQLGTGTYDFHPAITYTGYQDAYSWGAQYTGEIRLEDDNSEGYSWGDKHSLTAWGAYDWTDEVRSIARLTGYTQDKIDGIDSQIVAPVQTADPDNYGGDVLEIGLGLTYTGTSGYLTDHQFTVETVLPVHRDLNGPQLETDWIISAGWQYSF